MTEEEIRNIVRSTVKEVITELGSSLSRTIVRRGFQLMVAGILSWIAVHIGLNK